MKFSERCTVKDLTNVAIRLPAGMFSRIRNHMLRTEREQFGLVLAGHSFHDGSLTLLGHEYVVPDDKDLDYAHYTGVRISREFNNAILKRALAKRLSLIHVHSHPFAQNHVSFSGVDDRSEQQETLWLDKHFPHVIFGSVVMGQNCLSARIWKVHNGHPVPVAIQRIWDCDFPLNIVCTSGVASVDPPSHRFERQVRAFGVDGQRRIAMTTIGIVGLGGLGSLIAEGMARLGVSRFVLIDPDNVDETNANRLLGLTSRDIRLRRRKVDVAARELRRVNGDCEIRAMGLNVSTRRGMAALKRCDLIVAATDNHYSRLFLQTFAQQYVVPLLNTGVVIGSSSGRVTDALGDVQLFIPGHNNPCLLCSRLINLTTVGHELANSSLKTMLARSGYIRGDPEPAPAVRPLNAVTSNLALSIFHNLLCGFTEPVRALSYNMLDQSLEHYEFPMDAGCRICGPEGITGLGDTLSMTCYFEKALHPKTFRDTTEVVNGALQSPGR
jgi:molybdopterin/thiamine biosynthesis adenylyltransferase